MVEQSMLYYVISMHEINPVLLVLFSTGGHLGVQLIQQSFFFFFFYIKFMCPQDLLNVDDNRFFKDTVQLLRSAVMIMIMVNIYLFGDLQFDHARNKFTEIVSIS